MTKVAVTRETERTWSEYAADKTLPEKLVLKCGECGRETVMSHDAIIWWARSNEVLKERGEAEMVTREVARCNDCYAVFRMGDPVQTKRDRQQVVEVIRDLRKGKVVSEDRMKLVLAGPFSTSVEDAIRSLAMGSTRDQEGKRGKNADREALDD
jgi:hypothetical protein